MASKEYTFRNRRVTQQMNDPSSCGVKRVIMDQYDHFIDLKQHNERVKYLVETQEKLSTDITQTFNQLQQSQNKETVHQLTSKLNHLTDLHKKIKLEYESILDIELKPLRQGWPDIYDKVIDGIDRETLDHVLTVYDDVQSGKLTADEAILKGMDYMSRKYQLPDGFFNKSAVNQFNKNIQHIM